MNVPDWIEEILERLDMVMWDRFTVGYEESLGKFYTVYGWIEREEDEYKDFVLCRFFPETEDNITGFTTSSDEYTHEIHRRIFGDDVGDEHNDCRRVEHTFDIENAIELETSEQTTLLEAEGSR